MSRRPGSSHDRRFGPIDLGALGGVADQIVALIGKGAGGGAQGFFRVDAASLAHVALAVDTWSDELGLWPDLVQASGTAKPTWDPALFGGRGGLSFDGGDLIVSAARDLTGFERMAAVVTGFDSVTTGCYYLSFGPIANDGSVSIFANFNNAGGGNQPGSIQCWGRRAATGFASGYAESFALSSATVIEGRVDYERTSGAAEIWINGVEETDAHTQDANVSGATLGNHTLTIGMANGGGSALVGKLRHVLIAAWPAGVAFPDAALAQVVALLKADAGIA